MKRIAFAWVVILALVVVGCTRAGERKLLIDTRGDDGGSASVLVLAESADVSANLKANAERMGLRVEGVAVLRISGMKSALSDLTVPADAVVDALFDSRVHAESEPALVPDEKLQYMARKDLGVLDFLKANPTYDGRGVIVGVVDDGISPGQSGLSVTTDGKRKILKFGRQSSMLEFPLQAVSTGRESAFTKSAAAGAVDLLWEGQISEDALKVVDDSTGYTDLNVNGKADTLPLSVFQSAGKTRICVDANADGKADLEECFGPYSETGEFGRWSLAGPISVVGEFDSKKQIVSLAAGEPAGDSHGEGVASVLAGHSVGGKFDGMAPGAQIVDWDLTAPTDKPRELLSTLGDYLRGFEWVASNGASVANLSYSLNFESAKSQEFARKALAAIVRKYGIVLSFSGGNLGPGLGSGARRNMYPANALVAGAYVNPEMDEYVHGVTGLPPQGRVVSYSSRGPSPDGGAGPMMITPLASLVHGDPTTGFGPFSGTSSASPALGGLATLLISAAKQEGLPVDPTAVVHSLRLSARPIADTPFVDQGYGLPNISRAWAIYRSLIEGKRFAYVASSVLNVAAPDGSGDATGVFKRMSSYEGVATAEFRVFLQGMPSEIVPESVVSNLLVPVRLEYSAKWLSGPSRLWLSRSDSAGLSIGVDLDAARVGAKEGGEILGEVRVVEDLSDLVLHVIPITLVNDRMLTSPATVVFDLGADEGARSHIHVLPGVAGVRMRSSYLTGSGSSISFGFYNPSPSIVQNGWAMDQLLKVDRPGWHQVALSRRAGSALPLKIQAVLEPLWLALVSKGVRASAPELIIENGGGVQELKLVVKPASKQLVSVIVPQDGEGRFILEVDAPVAGTYSMSLMPVAVAEVSSPGTSCIATLASANGAVKTFASESVEVSAEKVGKIKFSCHSFEHTGSEWWKFSARMEARWAPVGAAAKPVAELPVRLVPGRSTIKLSPAAPLAAGQALEAELQTLFGRGAIPLGAFDTY